MYSAYHEIISPGYPEIPQPEILQPELDYDIFGDRDTRLRANKTTIPLPLHLPVFLPMSNGKS